MGSSHASTGIPSGRHLSYSFRKQDTGALEVEPRRALAVFRALNLADDRRSSQTLLDFSGRPANDAPAGTVITGADCAALAGRLRRAGYPLTDEGIRVFKMERGFSDAVRIGPDVASAYARFAKGVETRINLRASDWQALGPELRAALKILMVIGRDPVSLMSVRRALGVRDSDEVPNGVLLVGKVTAERLVRWAHQAGWTFDLAGLRKIAAARGVESMDIDPAMAGFVADAVLQRDEPAHDYQRFTRDGRTLNRRTILMLKAAQARLGDAVRLGVLKGSYVKADRRGAHPHMGGGVVDLSLGDASPAAIERAVLALREVGFAAWCRSRAAEPHVHAVAIGDRDMAPAAWWQVKAFFLGRDGRTRGGEDPHRATRAQSPAWVVRYRIPAM